MSCSIGDTYDYGDAGYMLTEKYVTARKKHKCTECREEIKPGTKYFLEKNILDGRIIIIKTCLDCLSVREAIFCAWTYGDMWDDLEENMFANYDSAPTSDQLSAMTDRGRDKVFELWEAVGEGK